MARPDFPRTLSEFQRRFGNEQACRQYLADSRWPDGYVCSRCAHRRAYLIKSRTVYECAGCGWQASLTAGTVMHKTRIPLSQWFWATRLLTTLTPGISALQLQRQLGLRSYQTAWTLCHKLRAGMVRTGRDRLSGTVEVDETYIGGPEHGKSGRGAAGKTAVVGAVEDRGTSAGRVRLQVIPDCSADSLIPFVGANVEPGSTVKTDGWEGYGPLDLKPYRHRPKIQGGGENAARWLPHIHRVFSNLKTWLKGTHHGVDPKHLQAYLNEFVFRYNRRRTPMAAFQTILGIGSHVKAPTYKELVGPVVNG
jgi:transposase-like protein